MPGQCVGSHIPSPPQWQLFCWWLWVLWALPPVCHPLPYPTLFERVPSPLLWPPRKVNKTTWSPLGYCIRRSPSEGHWGPWGLEVGFLQLEDEKAANGWRWNQTLHSGTRTATDQEGMSEWQPFPWRSRRWQTCQEEILAFSIKAPSSCFVSSFQGWTIKKPILIWYLLYN